MANRESLLRALRDSRGLSLKALYDSSGVSDSTIQKAERDPKSIKDSTWRQILTGLVPFGELTTSERDRITHEIGWDQSVLESISSSSARSQGLARWRTEMDAALNRADAFGFAPHLLAVVNAYVSNLPTIANLTSRRLPDGVLMFDSPDAFVHSVFHDEKPIGSPDHPDYPDALVHIAFRGLEVASPTAPLSCGVCLVDEHNRPLLPFSSDGSPMFLYVDQSSLEEYLGQPVVTLPSSYLHHNATSFERFAYRTADGFALRPVRDPQGFIDRTLAVRRSFPDRLKGKK